MPQPALSGTVRLLFVLCCLLPGPQVLVYLALWIIMPSEERTYFRTAA